MSHLRKRKKRFLDYSFSVDGFRVVVSFYETEEWWRAFSADDKRLVFQAVWLGKRFLSAEEVRHREAFMGKFTSKALAARAAQTKQVKAPPEKAFSEFPALQEFLTDAGNEKDGKRQRSPLSIAWEGGTYRLMLKELDASLVLFANTTTIYEGLALLDEWLQSDAPPWRFDRYSGQKNGKKK